MVCGFALLTLSIVGIIDIIVSLTLTILTCPLEILGLIINTDKLHFSRSFGFRVIMGSASSAFGLTYMQYANISQDTLNM